MRQPAEYFAASIRARRSSDRTASLGNRHVSILDDHDHVFGQKLRFTTEAASSHQAVAGVAIQLFTLGIPCVYYGTEQGFAGPEPSEWRWLAASAAATVYLREAMFGPEHPQADGLRRRRRRRSIPACRVSGRSEPPAGTASIRRTAPIAGSRLWARLGAAFPVLRHGRQYLRPTSLVRRPVRGARRRRASGLVADPR